MIGVGFFADKGSSRKRDQEIALAVKIKKNPKYVMNIKGKRVERE